MMAQEDSKIGNVEGIEHVDTVSSGEDGKLVNE
jgi:hypothetical protein